MTKARDAGGAELGVVDHMADVTLPAAGLARYTAYRTALIADEPDAARIVERLSLFLWELMEGCCANGVH